MKKGPSSEGSRLLAVVWACLLEGHCGNSSNKTDVL